MNRRPDQARLPKMNFMTEKRWKEIMRCKKDFMNGYLEDPGACECLDPDIAASWKRCREKSIDPLAQLSDLSLRHPVQDPPNYHPLDLELIKLSQPLFDAFDRWTPVRRFDLTLDSVLSCCQLLKNDGFVSDSKWNIRGRQLEEDVIGTNAYALAKLLRHPVAVQGPEYYIEELEDGFVSAAPIFDPGHNLIAVLQIAQTGLSRMREPWNEEVQLLFAQLLGLSSSMATAIENKLHLFLAGKTLESANNLYETTLSLIDYGIIVINKTGEILSANKTADHMLGRYGHTDKRSLLPWIPKNSRLVSLLEHGEAADFEETFHIEGISQKFLIQMRPLTKGNLCEGAVLSLQPAERADKIALSRTGNRAVITFGDIVGQSDPFRQALRKAELYSRFDENVLLSGESGTGKELFAQAIHNSFRPQGPFVALNCAAIPRDLIESELFGYERGSFTGANKEGRPGKIELAQNGTLFLDEIGDMPFELQAVLLRVLENKQVSRIGSLDSRKVNFRLIAATNKDLKKSAAENRFRPDLYYRLSVLSVTIPPLRERREDILALTTYFAEKCSKRIGRPTPLITEEAKQCLSAYDWPGNVRQLENTIISCIYMLRGTALTPESLPREITDFTVRKPDNIGKKEAGFSGDFDPSAYASLKDIEIEAIRRTLVYTGRNMSKTARILDISASTLYRKVKEYHL